jgi:two-component system OmpR family sensor kinase
MSRLLLGAALAPAAAGMLCGLLLGTGVIPRSIFVFRLLIGADVVAAGAGLLASAVALAVWWAWRWHARGLKQAVSGERRAQAQAWQRFVRRLNHELKNPLTAIRAGLANVADSDGRGTGRASLESMRRQVDRLSRLVGQLQKLAELESQEIEREPVDLTEIVEEAVELARAAPERVERSVDVSVQRAPWRPSPVRGDRDLLLLALYNALDNALKFSGPEATVEVRAIEDGARAIIEVADTGCGIAPDDLPHVTEELYRGQGSQGIEGSGLGLALVERIVALHGGELAIRSRKGEGTVVTLRLPLTR